MADDQLQLALDCLTHLFASGAAVLRGDDEAVGLLRSTEPARRPLCEAAIVVTAQAVRLVAERVDPEMLLTLTSDDARCQLFDAAEARLTGDRLTVFETIERLVRIQRPVTDMAAPLLAELWSVAAQHEGIDADVFARRLCLAAGVVGAGLADL